MFTMLKETNSRQQQQRKKNRTPIHKTQVHAAQEWWMIKKSVTTKTKAGERANEYREEWRSFRGKCFAAHTDHKGQHNAARWNIHELMMLHTAVGTKRLCIRLISAICYLISNENKYGYTKPNSKSSHTHISINVYVFVYAKKNIYTDYDYMGCLLYLHTYA